MSIEEKYDEVRQLISIGKEKGYLLYDEVNELLPSEITSSDELDDLFNTFGSAGIEVVDSEKAYLQEKQFDRTAEGAEEMELDLTPGALDKTNDPVRMYLREMGTVPLLTREGEVEIARRIERGKLSVIKSISRTPTVAKNIIRMGEQLKAGERTIRELVIFQDEEITDERVDERAREVQQQIETVRKARTAYQKYAEKLATVLKKDKRKYRRAAWKAMRAQVELSRFIRRIEFTELVKRKLIEEIKDQVEGVQRLQREIDNVDRLLNPHGRRSRLREEERKTLLKRTKELRATLRQTAEELEQTPDALRRTLPGGDRVPLPGGGRVGRHRRAEPEQPRLLSRVGVQPQGVVVLPGDVHAQGHAHDGGRAVRPAQQARGFVPGRVPGLADLASFGIHRHAGEIAPERRHHPPAPILGDDRDPVAGEVHRRRRPGRARRLWRARRRLRQRPSGRRAEHRHRGFPKNVSARDPPAASRAEGGGATGRTKEGGIS